MANADSNTPAQIGSGKAWASVFGTGVVIVGAWILDAGFGVKMPPEVVAATTGMVTSTLVYIVPHGG